MKFYVIGNEETVLGFQLVGIEGEIVTNADEANAALAKAFETEGLGIIIITERIADMIRQQVDLYVYKTTFPLIIEIPDQHGPVEGRGSVRDMIRAAVGINI